MLKFKRVSAKNYKSFKEVSLELDKRGLVLIEGKNLESNAFQSNGTGKSSLLELVTYAIYGETANSIKANEVVNRQIGKDTEVVLEFEQNGTPYTIGRYRKHKKHKNKVILKTKEDDISESTVSKTNEKIVDIIGVNYLTFSNSVMYGQGTQPLFSQATDKGKKEILENITSIEIYSKAGEVAKDKVKETELGIQVKEDKQYQENIKINSIIQAVEKEEERYQHVRDMIINRENALKEAKESLKSFPKADINHLKKKRESIQEPSGEFNPDTSVITNLEKELEDLEVKSNDFWQAINLLKGEVTVKQNEQRSLDTADVCPACGSPLSNEHAKERFYTLEQEINSTNETVRQYEQQYTNVFESAMQKKKERIQEYRIDLESARQEFNDKRLEIVSETQQLDSQIQNYERELQQLTDNVTRAENDLKEVESIPKPDRREGEISEIEKGIEVLKEETNKLFSSKVKYEDVVKAFSNKGIRSVVLDLVTPTLTNSANEYLQVLSSSILEVEFSTQVENQDGSLADRFDIKVFNNGEETSFQTLSTGEQTRVNVAISLALQDLVYSNNQLQTNIALYDEVFDGLDDIGITSIVEILQDKAKQIGSVFVITHSNTMKPLFENVITIEKKDNVSVKKGK